MNPVRVIHFIDSGGIYGAESVILNLSREMKEGSEFHPVVGCIVQGCEDPNDLFTRAEQEGIEAVKIRLNNKIFPLDLFRLATKFRLLKIDLIHSHGYKPSVAGFIAGKLAGIPVMATCHLWFSEGKVPLRYRFMTFLEQRLYRYFPLIACVSPHIKDILLKSGIHLDKIHIIRNGIDMIKYNIQKKEDKPSDPLGMLADIHENAKETVVVNVGRLCEQKAQMQLIQAAKILKGEGRRVKFLIVGEGPLRKSLEELILSLQLKKEVQLLGFRNDVADILRGSDIFALPSLDEGFPIALLEAMAAGVPAIATPVGMTRHLFEHMRDIYFIKPGDPESVAMGIRVLSENQDLREKIANAAKDIVSRCCSSRMMRQEYEVVYRKVLGFQTDPLEIGS
jgi:glycosyltransferase involved in cell wall biosynthesis